MTTNQTEAPTPPPPHQPTDLGSLRRSLGDRHIAGVAGGLARHFGIDPVIVRVALVVLAFFGGSGVIVYVGAWLLVPEEGTEEAVVRLDARSRSFLLYVVGALAALALLGDSIGDFHVPWGLLVVGIIVVVLVGNRERVRMRSRDRDDRATRSVYDTPVGAAGGVAPEPAPRTSYDYAAPDYSPYSAQVAADVEQRVKEKVDAKVARYQSRRRGPILFWFTVALILVTQGALGIADLAGMDVADAAYPAVALGVTGAMLVLGAFWGRAGGLILLGLLSAVALVGATAADEWGVQAHSHNATYAPTAAAAVQSSYHLDQGELVVDLGGVTDPQTLAGRRIDVSAHVGTITVIVPDELNVQAHAEIHGPGQIELFGEGHGGVRTSFSVSNTFASTGSEAAPLTIDAELNVGKITVETR